MQIKPIWIFTLGLIAWLTLPQLVQDGMFMDGTLYATVAKNMSEGLGTFWAPHFSNTWGTDGLGPFREHPPLTFAIQSLFFKILGTSIYTERIYIFCCMAFQLGAIALIWKKIIPRSFQGKGQAWLPWLLWFSIPLVFWGFQANIQENTMAIFVLMASYFALVGCKRSTFSMWPFLLSGLFILGASLCKGIPAFFPIAIPFLYWLVFERGEWKKMLLASSTVLGILFIAFAILYSYAPAAQALKYYINNRLILRIAENPTVDHRLSIIWRAFTELIPALLISLLLIAGVHKRWPAKSHRQWALLFALIGLSGIAPLALTKVQRGFYMNPAFPFIALSLACLCLPAVLTLRKKWREQINLQRGFSIFSWALLVSALIMTAVKIGDTKRHHIELHDTHLIGQLVPDGTTLVTDSQILGSGALMNYLARHYHIALASDSQSGDYAVYPVDRKVNVAKKGLELVPGDFQFVQLYKKIK